MEFDNLSNHVIGCALEVHKALGPGLLESAYQQCLAHELSLGGINFILEHELPVQYKGINLDCGYRADLIVDNKIVIELKSVEKITGVHKAQLLTYMKMSKIKTGLLINFNVELLKHGITRYVL